MIKNEEEVIGLNRTQQFDFSQCVRDMYMHENKKMHNKGFIDTNATLYLSRAEKLLQQQTDQMKTTFRH